MWGNHAGWAQTVMFVDDLREFKLQKLKTEQEKFEPTKNLEIKKSKRAMSQTGANAKKTKY